MIDLENEHGDSKAESADVAAGKKLAQHRHTWWAKLLGGIGKLGDQEPLYAVGAGLVAAGFTKRYPILKGTGASLLLKVGAADLAKRAVKAMVKRSRPTELLEKGRYEVDTGGSEDKGCQSFPSGHVACTVAAAAAVARRHPEAVPAVVAFTAAVAIARVVKGAHWPADVAAGLVVGLVVESVVSKAGRMTRHAVGR